MKTFRKDRQLATRGELGVDIKLKSMFSTPTVFWGARGNSYVTVVNDDSTYSIYSVNGIGEIRWKVEEWNRDEESNAARAYFFTDSPGTERMTYFIHVDNSYANTGGSTLTRFTGTYRELLLHLTESHEDDELDEGEPVELLNGRKGIRVRDMGIDDLERSFLNANGDGANYTTVFSCPDPCNITDFEVVFG